VTSGVPAAPAPHVIAGNLPFHLTTAMLRRILHGPGWTDAVLLVQWEVARRRAGVGGATMMTAQWWPWFEFGLVRKVSASSFRPRPSVDGGLITIRRRADPLVAPSDRRRYQAMVHRATDAVMGSRRSSTGRCHVRRFETGCATNKLN
jgi:23S rRNA (adenine-N6)-dimethyltransferase